MSWVVRSGWLLMTASVAMAGEFRLPVMPQAPTLDGRIEADEWAASAGFDGLAWQGQLDRRRAQVHLGATATTIFVAIRSQLPAEGPLLAAVDLDTVKLVYDDSVEVWIDPTPGSDHGRTFQMLANSLGHQAYDTHVRGKVQAEPGWRGHWELATTAHDGWWDCEIAVPVEELAPGRKATDGAWGINVCRNWKEPWAFSSVGGGPYAPTDTFVFDPAAPAVAVTHPKDPFAGELDSVLTVRNLTAEAQRVGVDLLLTRDVMPELHQAETLTVAPGQSQQAGIEATDVSTERSTLHARVTSVDGQTVYYDRTYSWQRGPAWQWTTTKQEVLPVDFQFAYYPTLNRMKVLIDVSNLPGDAELDHADCTVRRKGGEAVKTVRYDQFVEGKQEQTFDLPPLEGSYEVVVTAAGKNVPAGELAKPFERTKFEWEGLGLGSSHKVYPPFTPLRYEDHKVYSVLREHRTGAFGLWEEVTAAGKPLLTGHMRYEVKVDGAGVGEIEGKSEFDENGVADDRIAYHGQFAPKAQPALAFQYHDVWDVDGTMRCDLTLPATGGRSLDELTLEIPLRADQATHLHAMGDGIRNTLYEPVPEGNGVVWDSSKVAVNDLPANFCSYLYIGTPVRGLCWFAENDNGWSWDRTTPNLELVREGDTVLLRVHLINQPTVVDQPRTITFGLLAAPVKPRLSPWRYRWNRDQYSLLGTDINWFALGDCGAVYPGRGPEDLYYWEELKRGNEQELSNDEIAAVAERGKPIWGAYGPDYEERWVRHVNYNLRARRGKKMVFYYNRASCQLFPEFQTFQDEWDCTDFRTVGPGNGVGEIKIVPSPSYLDHALYWYGKSFDIGGNQGVYWDNWFFRGTYNTEMTAAYRRNDGSVVPATGLWGMRELSKRTFQYLNERGMVPITMPHMTSTSILPMLSFATVQYDWEWKYSEGDVQYRFPRDYIVLVSNGELAGTWPVLLGDHGKLASDPWTQRTFAAVCIVHELNGYGLPAVWDPLLTPIYELLDDPHLEVWRYWDERPQPVTSGDSDLPTIVYAVPGRSALFAVTSYSEQDEQVTLTIEPGPLGFAAGHKVVDVETGEELPVKGNRVSFTLKKHDIRECRIVPGGGGGR